MPCPNEKRMFEEKIDLRIPLLATLIILVPNPPAAVLTTFLPTLDKASFRSRLSRSARASRCGVGSDPLSETMRLLTGHVSSVL